ncbi:thioredoxin family protein [Catenovulum sp. 2E275]|uniref:thioredoxin family protein n=1 Tax=Catenovulum sp. 2E275 TaxID=2980497 RepID=UPI0021D06B39|nr:thioredoxin family protein [Catenovulum sp. 2E275]MCU4675854.1 thioredoxin family protein [Catenovulum sp. 2E275]
MVMTASNMMDLGTKAPDFTLKNTEGSTTSLADFKDAKALVVMFICNHCPYVIHIAPKLAELAKSYQEQGVEFVAINSNDSSAYPDDSFDKMVSEKAQRGYPFAYLVDEDQMVAKAYDAACTPDIFVFDQDKVLAYRGQFDASRPFRISSGNYDSTKNPATGEDLAYALDCILAGKTIDKDQLASIGCNIKWKPGNEPS